MSTEHSEPTRTGTRSGARVTDTKTVLRDTVLPALAAEVKYFSIQAVRECLRAQGQSIQPDTLKRYLYGLRKEGILFDAGKGWYSTLPETFMLPKEPVRELVALLEKQFPLLEFSAWSTGQVKAFTHDTLAQFVGFVYVERHNIASVAERVLDAGYFVYANPRGNERQVFTVRQKTIVIRPRVTTQPCDGHFVIVEGLLVDLFVEASRLPIMGLTECQTVFENIAGHSRISIARLMSYAQQRQPAAADILKAAQSTFSGVLKYP
jgi:hypothetical protein